MSIKELSVLDSQAFDVTTVSLARAARSERALAASMAQQEERVEYLRHVQEVFFKSLIYV